MSKLRVVAWDDPRCVQPLEAAAKIWQEQHGDEIEIILRPLTAFNDQPLSELSPICDVMIIDYPHIAQALEEKAIDPIDSLVSAEQIETIKQRSLGSTQESFDVDGVVAAFASDAACHVSAFKPSQFIGLSASQPTTWDDVFALQQTHPEAVAFALYPTDAISCLISLSAGVNAAPDGGTKMFTDTTAALSSIEMLKKLSGSVPEYCWDCTPQKLFAEAEQRNEIAYIPFTFGYTRKVKEIEGGWRYTDLPEGSGSLLGGAGMAVSSESPIKEKATQFIKWYCGDEGQLLAGKNWGQPSGLSAWDNDEVDELVCGFYSSTRATQENAYVRPRKSWWPAIQDETGQELVDMLRKDKSAKDILDQLEGIYNRHYKAVY